MKMKIKIKLFEELLATKPDNPDVFADYVASKHPDGHPAKDELENAENVEQRGTSVFHRQEDCPGIYDYQIKGFFKDACGAMNRFDKEFRDGMDKLSAYKSKIDGCIFVFPRFIPITIPEGGQISLCERPLIADTAQGRRVSVARSETVPPDSTLECEIEWFTKELGRWIQLWLDYGKLRGLGQWRNSGKGRFTWGQLDG
jgi:hypothetical protein